MRIEFFAAILVGCLNSGAAGVVIRRFFFSVINSCNNKAEIKIIAWLRVIFPDVAHLNVLAIVEFVFQ